MCIFNIYYHIMVEVSSKTKRKIIQNYLTALYNELKKKDFRI